MRQGVVAVNNAFQCPLPDNSQNPYHGKPCEPGYDAHYSPSKKELVIFNPKQILPCFVIEMTKVEYSDRGRADYYGDDFPDDYPELLQEALSKFKKGAYAIDPDGSKVGKVIADPDSDNEVKLRFADGSSSSFLSVTKIASASKQQIEKYDAEVA